MVPGCRVGLSEPIGGFVEISPGPSFQNSSGQCRAKLSGLREAKFKGASRVTFRPFLANGLHRQTRSVASRDRQGDFRRLARISGGPRKPLPAERERKLGG